MDGHCPDGLKLLCDRMERPLTRTRRQADLTAETFGRLLDWLDQDRERAGQRYEQIRLRLIKIFTCRGCTRAEELADETINRVAEKTQQIAETYVGDPAAYFQGVAENIYREYRRKTLAHETGFPADLEEKKEPVRENTELQYRCLEQCMERFPAQNRELILSYYGSADNPRHKIGNRKALSERLGIGANALWIRAHRIREGLKKCIVACVERMQAGYAEGIE
jgi:DNA-directed RNA polymerase specialized sigma24 family protein